MQFKENYIISGKIRCETGLHIGGSKETIEIGGIDNVVLRDSVTKLPFIPGSSLKGKMRALLELSDPVASKNIVDNKKPEDRGKPCDCGKCLPCKIFGVSASNDTKKDEKRQKGPTRLIVRDAYPTSETINRWDGLREMGDIVMGAELKYENTLDRITSMANPRPMERVPKDSEFEFEMVFGVYDDEDIKNMEGVFHAMKLLEDSYIGGSGTRGYGKIKFAGISIISRTVDYYKSKVSEQKLMEDSTIDEILASKNLFG